MATEKEQCSHLKLGELAKHATVRFETVPPEQNTTTYAWDTEIELCVYCSGYMRGALFKVAG